MEVETIIIDDDDDDDYFDNNHKDENKPADGSHQADNNLEDLPQTELELLCELKKPKLPVAQLITLVLVNVKNHQATAEEISDLVTEKFPFYNDGTSSIMTCLTKREKFFIIVGYTESNLPIWTFNPEFKTILLMRWVPNYMEDKGDETSTEYPVTISTDPLTVPITWQDKMDCRNESSTDLNLEFVCTDKILEPPIDCNSMKSENPFKSETNKTSEKTLLEMQVPGGVHHPNKFKHSTDLCLDNLNSASAINKDEFLYRVHFYMGIDQRDPTNPAILQCRLHCTVCDSHLGIAASDILANVRMHSSLSVLVCNHCYALTDANPQTFVGVCQWCFKVDGVHFLCSTCPAKCCEECLKRNFGGYWSNMIAQKPEWMCFLCDIKQIWPHRAVAYLLLRYYLQLKEQNNLEGSADITACCKPISLEEQSEEGFLPVLTLPDLLSPNPVPSLAKLAEFVKSHQTLHISEPILEPTQSLNPFYMKSSLKVPPKSSNTGMHYINNYVDSSHLPPVACVAPSVVATATKLMPKGQDLASRPIVKASPYDHHLTERLVFRPCTDKNLTQKPFPQSSENNIIKNTMPQEFCKELNEAERSKTRPLSSDNTAKVVRFQASSPNQDPPSKPIPLQKLVDLNLLQETTPRDFSPEENAIKIVSSNNFLTNQLLHRRPMPKSKRAMLLKNLLIKSGIEASEKNFTDEIGDIDSDSNSHNFSEDFTPQPSNIDRAEEPFLKSIIDSATERLINLHKRQGASFNNNDTDDCERTNLKICSEKKSYYQNELECESSEMETPKIKVRTVQELQGCGEEVFQSDDKPNVQDDNDTKSEFEMRLGEPPEEVNLESLKEGIIDASRIAVNTQKRFKELAKIISSTSSFKKSYATKLVNQFQYTLKSCQRDMNLINKSIELKFSGLKSLSDMDLILNSIKKSTDKERVNHKAAKRIIKRAQLGRKFKYDKDLVMITDVRSLADDKVGAESSVKNSQNEINSYYGTEKRLLPKARNTGDPNEEIKDFSEDKVSMNYDSFKDKKQLRKDLEMRQIFLNRHWKRASNSLVVRRRNQETAAQSQVKRKRGRPPGSKTQSSIDQSPGKKKNNDDSDSDASIGLGSHHGRSNTFDSDASESDFSSISSKYSTKRTKLFRRSKLPRTPQRLTRNTSLQFGTFVNTVSIKDGTVIPFPMNFIIKACSVALERVSSDVIQKYSV